MVKITKKESGFGLLGLIFVIAIIGVFTGGGFYFKELQQQKSLLDIGRDAEKKAQELKTTIEGDQKKIIDELNNQGRVCTQEAKQCPNGSYVSRTGPNCEFARCPDAKSLTGDIIFGQQAEKLCGPQPPAACGPSKQLGCDLEAKHWGCYSINVDTSNWKTYRNEKYGFEVRYPKEWEKEPGYQESEEVMFSHGLFMGDVKEIFAEFSITMREVSDDFIKFWNGNLPDFKGKTRNIGGERAIVEVTVSGIPNTNIDETLYTFIHGNRFFGIQMKVWRQKDFSHVKYINELDTVISTFKFVPSTGSGQTK